MVYKKGKTILYQMIILQVYAAYNSFRPEQILPVQNIFEISKRNLTIYVVMQPFTG